MKLIFLTECECRILKANVINSLFESSKLVNALVLLPLTASLPVLMIMASHQTFSGQLKHLTGQTKFGQSNFLHIINGKVIKFLIEKSMSGQFSILIISTALLSSFHASTVNKH